MKVLAAALLAASFLFTSAAPSYAQTEIYAQEATPIPMRFCKILQHISPFCKQAHQ